MPAMLTRRGGEVYAPPRNDAYVVLLIISLVAMILGCALLWLDYSSYPADKAPDKVSVRQPAPAAGAPQGGQQPTPVAPPGGAGQPQPPPQQQPQTPPAPPPDGGKKQ